jgi:Spy/CpxP family protein refolding chaperone
MKTRILIVAVLGAALLGAGAVTVSARADAGSLMARPMMRHLANSPLGNFITGQIGRLLVLKSKMDVTDEQREKIVAIVKGHRQDIAVVAKPIVDKRRVLRDAVLADTPDEKAVRAAAADLGKAIGEAAVLAAKIKGEAGPVLTPDQHKALADFRAESDAAVDAFLVKMSAK